MITIILVSFCAIIFMTLMIVSQILDKHFQKGLKITLVILDIFGIVWILFVNYYVYQKQLQKAYYNGIKTEIKIEYKNNQMIKQDTIFYIE